MTEKELAKLPYVFILRNKEKHPLFIGAYGGTQTWEEGMRVLAERYASWWDEVADYILWHFHTEKRAWEYAMYLIQVFTPIYQPEETEEGAVPPPALLDAMVDPSPTLPGIRDGRPDEGR